MTTLKSMLDLVLEVPPTPWQGPIPVPDRDNGPFWDGLRRHQLLIMRCPRCGYRVHPPLAGCPRCQSPELSAEPVSGRGTVYSFTVVNREFAPGIKPPYVVAYVDLEEQENLRFTTNLVNVRIGDIKIGMPVQVLFHDAADMTLALFEPAGGSTGV